MGCRGVCPVSFCVCILLGVSFGPPWRPLRDFPAWARCKPQGGADLGAVPTAGWRKLFGARGPGLLCRASCRRAFCRQAFCRRALLSPDPSVARLRPTAGAARIAWINLPGMPPARPVFGPVLGPVLGPVVGPVLSHSRTSPERRRNAMLERIGLVCVQPSASPSYVVCTALRNGHIITATLSNEPALDLCRPGFFWSNADTTRRRQGGDE